MREGIARSQIKAKNCASHLPLMFSFHGQSSEIMVARGHNSLTAGSLAAADRRGQGLGQEVLAGSR